MTATATATATTTTTTNDNDDNDDDDNNSNTNNTGKSHLLQGEAESDLCGGSTCSLRASLGSGHFTCRSARGNTAGRFLVAPTGMPMSSYTKHINTNNNTSRRQTNTTTYVELQWPFASQLGGHAVSLSLSLYQGLAFSDPAYIYIYIYIYIYKLI